MTSEKRAQKFHTDDVSLNKQDLGSVSDWLKQISHVAGPIRSTSQIREVILQQYGNNLRLVLRRHFSRKRGGGVGYCRLVSQTILLGIKMLFLAEMQAKVQQYGRLKRKKSCGNCMRNLKARMVCVTFVVLTTILCLSHKRKTNP